MTKFFKDVTTSQTLLINQKSNELEKDGHEIYKFGFGQSPVSPPKFVRDALSRYTNQHYYSSVQGIIELREAIAKFHKDVDNLDFDAENILIAPGSKILLYAIMSAFTEADILIPAPSWVSYAPQADLLGHKTIWVEADYQSKWKITPKTLKDAFTKKKNKQTPSIIILNYPSNPIGITYSAGELKELAEILRENDCYVISDEIYGLLHHEGNHHSIAHDYPEKTIITTGLSKWCGGGGWRLGAALLPESLRELKDVMLGIASETYSCAPTPVQLAAVEAYNWNDEIKNYVVHQRRILKLIGNKVTDMLNDADIKTHNPEGGFYIFPDFSGFESHMQNAGIKNSSEMCQSLLQESQVALLPGTAFGLSENKFVARLSFVNFDGNSALEESYKIGLDEDLDEAFISKNAPKVLKGIEKIIEWTVKISGSQKLNKAS